MDFSLFPWRFCFTATDSIYFPPGLSANVLRGAFGTLFRHLACAPDCPGARTCANAQACPYARIFEPRAAAPGPSGLADWPRPFVFRAAHLDGLTFRPGEPFHFDLNVFDLRTPVLPYFEAVFAQIADQGLGPRRGRARLDAVSQRAGVEPAPLTVSLLPPPHTVRQITVQFLTPLELKSGEAIAERPDFTVLFNRARDRVATLRTLYGAGPLDLDFRGMGERSRHVRMTDYRAERAKRMRTSSRTGQTHSIGGITGAAVYEGVDLAEFVPILQAAEWTGVGRQTVWGKGHIRVELPPN